MSDQFVGEIRIFPFNYAPSGWALCDGQLLSISQNTAVFSLLGTNYGGNGTSDFALPNLQGSAAMHTTQYAGSSPYGNFPLGAAAGETSVTLLTSEIPTHSHTAYGEINHANTTATAPNGAVTGNATPTLTYSKSTSPSVVAMNPAMVSVAGGSAAHTNMMPYLTMNFCIALQGIFPSR